MVISGDVNYKLYEQLNSEHVVVFLNALQVDRKEGYKNHQFVPYSKCLN